MAQGNRKHTATISGQLRAFPSEAYDYHDDVTREGVAQMRDRAGVDPSKRRLRKIDGYGCVVDTANH